MHDVGSETGLAAKALAKQVGDIRLVFYDQQLALRADSSNGKLTLMALPLPLSSGEYGAIER